MPRTLAEWFGVSGFFLALAGLYLQWRRHKRDQQNFKEEREPKLSVRAFFGPLGNTHDDGWYLQVYVVNIGRSKVHIKSVGVICHSYNWAHDMLIPEPIPKQNPLVPGDERYFCLLTRDTPDLARLRDIPTQNIEIHVESPERVIHRLTGREVHWIGIGPDSEAALTR